MYPTKVVPQVIPYKGFAKNEYWNEQDFIYTREFSKLHDKSATKMFWPLWVYFIFFKIIGLATVSVEIFMNKKKKKEIIFVCHKLDVVYNLSIIIGMIIWCYFELPFRYSWQFKTATALKLALDVILTVLGLIMLIMIYSVYSIRQRSLLNVINGLLEMDNRFSNFKRKTHRKRVFIKLLLLSFIFVILTINLFIKHVIEPGNSYRLWLINALPSSCICWHFFQYFLMVSFLDIRLAEVNYAIEHFTSISAIEVSKEAKLRSPHALLSRLRELYTHLAATCDDISEFYGLPTLFALTYIFSDMNYVVYDLLTSAVLSMDNSIDFDAMIHSLSWFVVYIYPLALLAVKISAIKKEFDKTGVAVNKTIFLITNKEMKTQLKQFSNQLLHHKYNFTAGGFFVLDSTLLHMIAAAIAANVVILIQFDAAHHSQNEKNCNRT